MKKIRGEVKNFYKKIRVVHLICVMSFILIGSVFLSVNDRLLDSSYAVADTNYIFLSDLDYITANNWSYVGWGSIQKDRNPEGKTITLNVDGQKKIFTKGLGIHATSQLTYNISEYSSKYTRFISKIGIDASRTANSNVWFLITASNDGANWTQLFRSGVVKFDTPAIDVDVDITGYKYLRIYVDRNGSDNSDHAVLGHPRLVTGDFVVKEQEEYTKLHPVAYYDEILNQEQIESNTTKNHRLILEREFVNKLGYDLIQDLVYVNPKTLETLDWILSDNERLEQMIEVGEISNAQLFLEVITNLYLAYKKDLQSQNGFVYQKMMIGLAAAYSTDRIISPLAFSFQTPTYDYMERFKIMKNFFDNHKFKKVKINALAGEFVSNEWFKNYHVQLMRMVMQDGTSNGDLIWLNGFTNEKQSVSFYMIDYVSPVYTRDQFYAEENKEKYDEQFYLTKYGVPYGLTNGTKIPRYWMVFANGGICWNASRVGQSMYRVNGIPATGAYQVGHELYIQYYEDDNGNGYWTPRYGNWSGAGSTWGGGNPYRYIFNWGNKYFADKHISGSKVASSTGYLYLGQANLNRYDQYKRSLYYNLLANSYATNEQKLAAYNRALEVNDLNLDSYDGIITLYKEMSVKNDGGTITSTDWYHLANRILKAYRYYPVAMYDLLNVIRPYLEGSERLHIDRLEKETLLNATRATANETIQVDAVRTHANQLLNKAQPDPMTFSFDGENAGKIVKNPIYQLAWGYSLDGGKTFTDFKIDDEIILTPEEIASITADNDIIINFMGLSYTFTIDITIGQLSPNLFANDLENRVVGVDLIYEWRNSENDSWTSYRNASPDNTGDKTLYVRRGATGTQLASESTMYTFTADNQPNTRKYIPVSHLSIHAVSTEATNQAGSAIYAIDGNYNTRYHSAWNGSDTERYMVIKLDKPRYVSAVEFVPAGGGNGKIYDGTIWGSMDGEKWEVLSQRTNLTYTNAANTIDDAKANIQSFEIADPIEVQYVKIVADRTNGNWFTARAFNLFQDLTSNERPTAGIGYSTTNPTTGNVIARLVNVSVENYEIISDGGDTHEFTENGEFTFRFKDKDTNLEGFAKAKVDWIDRIAPTATVEYSTTSPTNGHVIATLKPSEKVKILNNGYYQISEEGKVYDKDGILLEDYVVNEDGVVTDSTGKIIDPFKYEFIDNGEFTFEFEDMAGNKGSVTAKVECIDSIAPEATLFYDITFLTNKDVTVNLKFNEENVRILNNNGSSSYTFKENGEFTFEFEDAAGNRNSITAKVTWIDKTLPQVKIHYSTTIATSDPVVATLVSDQEIIIENNGGSNTYVFTKNGEFEFIYWDLVGNQGKIIAKVDWIESNPSKPEEPSDPSIPEEPNDPSKPENPSDSSKPEDPSDSSKPEDPSDSSKPEDPSDSSKPEDPSDSSKPEEPSDSSKPEDPSDSSKPEEPSDPSKPGNVGDEPIEYHTYVIDKFSLKVNSSFIQENYTLEAKRISLTEKLQEKINSDKYDYYEIYFRENNKSFKDMILTYEFPKGNKISAVYFVNNNNILQKLEYRVLSDNQIEIKANKLGKYLFVYEDEEQEEKVVSEEKKSEYNLLIVVIIILAITNIGLLVIRKKH